MALPAFDPGVHHVGLGADSASLKGYLVAGAFSKQLANPVFSKPSNVGTADLVGLRSLSNLTQDDYSGGEFQEDWSDPAMFAECVSMIPDQLTKRVRTARPIVSSMLNDLGAGAGEPVSLEHVGGYLFLVFNNGTPNGKVFRYHPSDPTSSPQRETVAAADLPAGKLITAAAWNRNTGRLWLGSNEPELNTFSWHGTAAAGSRLVHEAAYSAPSSASSITGIHIFGIMKIVVGVNRDTAAFSLGEDDSTVWLYVSGGGTSTKWTKVGNLPGNFVKAVTYNNAVYILSRGAGSDDDRSYLSMTQGSQVFPVVEFPYFFKAADMVEYAGRLYISGTGYDLDGNDHHGELYEVSGASLRLVRTFASQAWDPTPGLVGNPMTPSENGVVPAKRKRPMLMMKALCVAEGLLWMPDSSWSGLEAYDATTDAFYGGPRYRGGDDSSLEWTHMVPYGDSIYLWGRGGTAAETGLYRTERRIDTGGSYHPYLVTSDYAPEPAQLKTWSRFVIVSRGVVPTLEYSTDGGDSWTSAGAGTGETSGNTRITSFDLVANGIDASKRIRFKIVFPMAGTTDESASFLTSHSLSFMVRGDTKRRWQMTVIAALDVENLEQGDSQQVPSEVSSALWALKDQVAPVAFKDMDGTLYNVVITDIADHHTAIDPDAERFVQLSLLEV